MSVWTVFSEEFLKAVAYATARAIGRCLGPSVLLIVSTISRQQIYVETIRLESARTVVHY